MARQPRIDYPGSYHHVMNRGTNHQDVFFADIDRVDFGRLLDEIHDRFGVSLDSYCLMDNHYHLLIHCPNGNLSEAMQHLGSTYTRHVNDRLDRDGPLFRGRFRSIPITTDRYRTATRRYIHRNCLDIDGVTSVSDYRWSSHRAYLGLRKAPRFLDIEDALSGFASPTDFDAFVSGSDRFMPPGRNSVDDAASTVRLAIAEFDSREADHSPQWLERTVTVLVADRVGGAISELVPPLGSAARRSARSRATARARSNPDVGRMVAFACDILGDDDRLTVSESA